MPTSTNNRVAVVTRAARGIGAEIARRLGADGFAIAVVDLDEGQCAQVVEHIESSGVRALAIGVDVTDESGVATAVDRVADLLVAPTVIMNCAGILRDNLLFRMSVDDWDAVVSVHLRGAFLDDARGPEPYDRGRLGA